MVRRKNIVFAVDKSAFRSGKHTVTFTTKGVSFIEKGATKRRFKKGSAAIKFAKAKAQMISNKTRKSTDLIIDIGKVVNKNFIIKPQKKKLKKN